MGVRGEGEKTLKIPRSNSEPMLTASNRSNYLKALGKEKNPSDVKRVVERMDKARLIRFIIFRSIPSIFRISRPHF